ncbi:hypothetical protein [Stenotrophomonas pigmentata]|uniref:hypothetical protein n=1 Tax=Stenotrophomonas pigmentata TaxID=3055080 RepID=UPI0026F10FF7|nr:hypothetical protein [Stenotrophomonas sp. 610A2]
MSNIDIELQARTRGQLTKIKIHSTKLRERTRVLAKGFAKVGVFHEPLRPVNSFIGRKYAAKVLNVLLRDSEIIPISKRDKHSYPPTIHKLMNHGRKQRKNHSPHGAHRSPSIPPNHAILREWPALANTFHPTHSLIPLWIKRHFAMGMSCPQEASDA